MALNSLQPFQSFTRRWEKDPAFAWAMSALWLVLLCGIAFWWHLGSVGLIDETEPLFAEAARQMTLTGDWITPYFNEATRFDKPPLVYWLMAIAYQVVGVNEWAVRFPSALAASVLVIFGFFVLRRFGYPTPLLGQDDDSISADRRGDAPRWWAAWIGGDDGPEPANPGMGQNGRLRYAAERLYGFGLVCFFLGLCLLKP